MPVLEQLKQMSPERFLELYQGLEVEGYGPLDKEVALALKFRPQMITKLPMEQRARRARRILESQHNVELCYELFGAWLLRHHKLLVTKFLDLTGVTHENGMIEDVEGSLPDATKVAGAIAQLDGEFPPEAVTLYLAMAAEQWPAVSELAAAWKSRVG